MRFLPWELLTWKLSSDFTPLQSVRSLQQGDIPLNFPEKQCRKASSYELLNIFFFVCTTQFKRILGSLHVTLPSLKVCIKPQGQDALILVALFCWRKTSKDEKHQREQQSDGTVRNGWLGTGVGVYQACTWHLLKEKKQQENNHTEWILILPL